MHQRRLIIHSGLHKTGTTALQKFLSNNEDPLRQAGVLFPRIGRHAGLGGGHHNIAWYLTRDRRYQPAFGGIEHLAEEISRFDGDVLLSSEDFESLLDRLPDLDGLLRHPKLAHLRCEVVVYIRDQISYAESLYRQLLVAGWGDECLPTMSALLQQRGLTLWEWRYQFDFARLLAHTRAQPQVDVTFRSYAGLADGRIVPDFMAAVLPQATLPEAADLGEIVNQRMSLLECLSLFYANRSHRRLTSREVAACWLLQRATAGTALVLPHAIRTGFAAAFNAGNASFAQATGWPHEHLHLDSDRPAPPQALFMDRVFSFETQQSITAMAAVMPAGLLPDADPKSDPEDLPANLRGLLQLLVAHWRSERRA